MMTALRASTFVLAALALVSCENMKNNSGGGQSSPYASNYGGDGHYNPYPGQAGYAQGGAPAYQQPATSAPNYQTPPTPTYTPPPQPPADPYAFNAGSSTPSRPKTTASSSAKKKTTTSAKTAAKKKPTGGGRYTVAKNDTLYGIARKKGTTVAKIKAANGLSSDVIRPGQALKIP